MFLALIAVKPLLNESVTVKILFNIGPRMHSLFGLLNAFVTFFLIIAEWW